MAEQININEDVAIGFRRQRRNLMLLNSIFSVILFTGAGIMGEVNLLGTKIMGLSNGELFTILAILWLYWNVRYFSYKKEYLISTGGIDFAGEYKHQLTNTLHKMGMKQDKRKRIERRSYNKNVDTHKVFYLKVTFTDDPQTTYTFGPIRSAICHMSGLVKWVRYKRSFLEFFFPFYYSVIVFIWTVSKYIFVKCC